METKDNYLQKKLNKILETRYDSDKDILQGLNFLGNSFENGEFENTLNSRRNLRSQIEKRNLEINQAFLENVKIVKITLDALSDSFTLMEKKFTLMKNCLKNTQDKTVDLIKQTNLLQEESNKLILRKQISGTFLQSLSLSSDEHRILYGQSRDDPITNEFFTVLDRVQQIHHDECRVLMQSGFETLALDIIDKTTFHYEAALERVYKWVQSHCRVVDATNEIVIKGMNRLQDRPALFKYVIDEYSTNRRSLLSRSFIHALTLGDKKTKPIELHVDDPKRYIGDIFAWLHQAIPNEKENLLMLCKLCDKNDLTELIQQALVSISDGLCHTLKVRVEMILLAEKETILLYSISNLIRFYLSIINSVVKGGQLEQCLVDIQNMSETVFLNLLSMQVKDVLMASSSQMHQTKQQTSDLIPPPSVSKLLNMLKELLSVANMVEGRQTDIVKIVGCVIDPLLQSVTESAINMSTQDMSVYLLNSIYQIQSVLNMYEFMDERLERLSSMCEAQLDTLTSQQASSLVLNLQLGPIYTVLQSDSTQLNIEHLKLFMNKLDAFIEMPDILILPQVNLLLSSTHRGTVQKRSFNVIIAIYKQLYEKIYDPVNGHQNPETILAKSPEQVAEFLSG